MEPIDLDTHYLNTGRAKYIQTFWGIAKTEYVNHANKGKHGMDHGINLIEGIMFALSASHFIISRNRITKFILFSWNHLALPETHESDIMPYNYGRI